MVVAKVLGVIVAAIILVFLFSVVCTIPVWLLWNWLCPKLFGLPALTLVQAWGLSLLCGFLFKANVKSGKD